MRCPNCESSDVINFIKNDDLRLFVCQNCELIFKDNIINIDYQKLDKDYYMVYNFNREKEVRDLIKIIKKYIKKEKISILEIGCGTGAILNEFGKKGFNVFGYEPSAIACNVAREKFGIDTIKNDYFKKNEFRLKPDVILLYDVLEHLNDPISLFNNIKSSLNKGSIFMIKSGNPFSFNARLYPSKWTYYYINQHIAFYNQKALKFLLNKTGLKIVHYYQFKHAYGGCDFINLIKNIVKSVILRTTNTNSHFYKNRSIGLANDHFIGVLKRND